MLEIDLSPTFIAVQMLLAFLMKVFTIGAQYNKAIGIQYLPGVIIMHCYAKQKITKLTRKAKGMAKHDDDDDGCS